VDDFAGDLFLVEFMLLIGVVLGGVVTFPEPDYEWDEGAEDG